MSFDLQFVLANTITSKDQVLEFGLEMGPGIYVFPPEVDESIFFQGSMFKDWLDPDVCLIGGVYGDEGSVRKITQAGIDDMYKGPDLGVAGLPKLDKTRVRMPSYSIDMLFRTGNNAKHAYSVPGSADVLVVSGGPSYREKIDNLILPYHGFLNGHGLVVQSIEDDHFVYCLKRKRVVSDSKHSKTLDASVEVYTHSFSTHLFCA